MSQLQTGDSNIAIGLNAMRYAIAANSTITIGTTAMLNIASSGDTIAIGSGAISNAVDDATAGIIAIGSNSGLSTDGLLHTFIGHQAGRYCKGLANVCIGAFSGPLSATDFGGQTAIGFNAKPISAANTVMLGEPALTCVYTYADLYAYYSSDLRLKESIKTIKDGLTKLLSIRGVIFS